MQWAMPICSGASLSIPQHPRCSKRPSEITVNGVISACERRGEVSPPWGLGDMKDTDGINWDQMAKKNIKKYQESEEKTRINQI